MSGRDQIEHVLANPRRPPRLLIGGPSVVPEPFEAPGEQERARSRAENSGANDDVQQHVPDVAENEERVAKPSDPRVQRISLGLQDHQRDEKRPATGEEEIKREQDQDQFHRVASMRIPAENK